MLYATKLASKTSHMLSSGILLIAYLFIADDRCELPIVSGPCEAAIPSWGYSATAKQCQQFTYGGCGGNKNKFNTKEACNARCNRQGSVKQGRVKQNRAKRGNMYCANALLLFSCIHT